MRRKLIIVIIAVALTGAVATLAAVFAPPGVGAQEETTTTTASPEDPQDEAEGDHGRGHRGRMREIAGVVAETIGISTDELREAVQGGQSIAQVAEDQDVDPQEVVDAIVEHVTARLTERAEQFVNRER